MSFLAVAVAFTAAAAAAVAVIPLFPPHPSCNIEDWFYFREKLRRVVATKKKDFAGEEWESELVEAVRRSVDNGAYTECTSGVLAMRLLVAYRSLQALGKTPNVAVVEGWLADNAQLLSVPLTWRLVLDPFPIAGLLAFLHMQLLDAQSDVLGEPPARSSPCEALLNRSVFSARRIRPFPHGALANDMKQHLVTNCGSIGLAVSLVLYIGANATLRPPPASDAAPLLARVDELGLTWGAAFRSRWPLLRLLDRLHFHWFYHRCPQQSYGQWTRTTPPFMICVPTDLNMLAYHMVNQGYYPECNHMQRWMPKATSACDLVVDVGASIGVCALLFAAMGHNVLAIDPNGRHVALMRVAAAMNGFVRFRAKRAAVADLPGKGRLLLPLDGALGVLEYHNEGVLDRLQQTKEESYGVDNVGHVSFKYPGRVRSIPVPVTTVDYEVGERPVCFLKIDAEGSDHLVLQGARRSLASARLVSFESNINGHAVAPGRFSSQNLLEELRNLGFTLQRLGALPGSKVKDNLDGTFGSYGVFIGYRRAEWPWTLP